MALGFAARALALRVQRLVQAAATGLLNFSFTKAGALVAAINEDF